MKWKRIYRDLLMLSLLCGAFYVSTIFVGQIGDANDPPEPTFSKARVNGDRLVQQDDWKVAARQFKVIAQRDPYDGYACWRLGHCENERRHELQLKLEAAELNGASPQTFEALKSQLTEQKKTTLETLLKSREFLRYRGEATKELAYFHAESGQYETAMDYLEEFVGEGNWVFRGLANQQRLGEGGWEMMEDDAVVTPQTRLHRFERFWKIVRQERIVRDNDYHPHDHWQGMRY